MATSAAHYYYHYVVGGGADEDQGVGVGLIGPVGPDAVAAVGQSLGVKVVYTPSESKLRQPRMPLWPRPQLPVVLALRLRNG